MKLPFAVIDFEASALSLSAWPELSSYPIEVGFACAGAAGHITTWSSLIKPVAAWWRTDRQAERVHGLTRVLLEQGAPPEHVAATLNTMPAPYQCVRCDGGRYDAHWLRVLFATAQLTPAFELADMANLACDVFDREAFVAALATTMAPHRAGPDPARLCHAMMAARQI